MRIHLLAVGTKMPVWVDTAYTQFAQRLPRHLPLMLKPIALGQRRGASDVARAQALEGERLRKATPAGAHVVALERDAEAWSTEQLSDQMQRWQQAGKDVALWIGGPDGFDRPCLDGADQRWSLGPLTLPHGLVRVVVAEQLYRAWSLSQNHPYHRP